MKILFLTQLLPYPPRTGGTYKTFSTLSLLAKKHEVHVVTFHDDKKGTTNSKKLEKNLDIKVKSFYRPKVTAPSQEIKHIALRSLFTTKPFRVYKYYDKRAADYLRLLSRSDRFDVVYIDHNTSFQYLHHISKSPKARVVFDEHNINSLAMWRNAWERKRPIEVRLFSLLDVVKNYFYERKIAKSVDAMLCISEADKEKYISRGANPAATRVLPLPFKIDNQFSLKNKNNILIAALMSWAPNKYGILWFYENVYPLVKKEIPNITLTLVGPRPEEEIRKIAKSDDSVIVTGEVPDLLPYYKKAGIFIAPTFSGSGLRIKVPHALASGIPVVSTSYGVEGLLGKEDSGVIVADDEKFFAGAVIRALKEKKLAKKLSKKGIRYIKKHYSEKEALRVLNSTL